MNFNVVSPCVIITGRIHACCELNLLWNLLIEHPGSRGFSGERQHCPSLISDENRKSTESYLRNTVPSTPLRSGRLHFGSSNIHLLGSVSILTALVLVPIFMPAHFSLQMAIASSALGASTKNTAFFGKIGRFISTSISLRLASLLYFTKTPSPLWSIKVLLASIFASVA